jgi:DNA mismatch endonuclease, patch repair protein
MARSKLAGMTAPTGRMISLGAAVRVAYPAPSSAAATAVMQGNRSRDTRPEVLLRSALHRRGLRFRKDYVIRADGRRCRADVVFTRQQVAVFVDGCFWHGCPEHGRTPRTNHEYWRVKLGRNVERDQQSTTALINAGWKVMRVWEHERVDVAVESIVRALTSLGRTT